VPAARKTDRGPRRSEAQRFKRSFDERFIAGSRFYQGSERHRHAPGLSARLLHEFQRHQQRRTNCRESVWGASATDLYRVLEGWGRLADGATSSLVAKLKNVLNAFDAGDKITTCGQTDAFTKYVRAQAGKKLTPGNWPDSAWNQLADGRAARM
jgi:hypothetical protein